LQIELREFFLEIISENQGGFVPKQKIIDSVIIIQEAIHGSIQRKEKGIIVKLDMANSFRVRHNYLATVLKKFGFLPDIIETIQACISTP